MIGQSLPLKSARVQREEIASTAPPQKGARKGSRITYAGWLIPKMVRNGVRHLNVSSG
jgi:hypothetical protein